MSADHVHPRYLTDAASRLTRALAISYSMPNASAVRTNSRRSVIYRVVASISISILIGWLVMVAPLPFISSWWKSSDPNGSGLLHIRHRMADWLVLTRRLLGTSSSDVVALLGRPPPADKFRGNGLVYLLGPERGLISIDNEWLILTIGKGATVENAHVKSD